MSRFPAFRSKRINNLRVRYLMELWFNPRNRHEHYSELSKNQMPYGTVVVVFPDFVGLDEVRGQM